MKGGGIPICVMSITEHTEQVCQDVRVHFYLYARGKADSHMGIRNRGVYMSRPSQRGRKRMWPCAAKSTLDTHSFISRLKDTAHTDNRWELTQIWVCKHSIRSLLKKKDRHTHTPCEAICALHIS